MSGPSVVVDWAPDGWTHIGGPGMHLLIGLAEDDEQTLVASDAADGGDLDDVIDVLTSGGMRSARHFVGVHWEPRTRLVAFGPVAATVTLPDGSEHEVRAASPRVWTDVELAEHPAHVRLRVLDETEATQVAEQPGTRTSTPRSAPAGAKPVDHPVAQPTPPAPAEQPATGVPTFGGPAVAGAPPSSPWRRSWAQPSPAAPAAPPAPSTVASAPEPAAPVAPQPAAVAEQPTPEVTSAPEPPRLDVESTLSARSLVEPATHAATPDDVDDTAHVAAGVGDDDASGGADGVPPSYDYLFGHTTTVDEHRRVLAELKRPGGDDDDDGGEPDVLAGTDEGAAEPPLGGLTGAPSGPPDTAFDASPTLAQGLSVPGPPLTSTAEPVPAERGVISSVPWATPAAPVATPASGVASPGRAEPEPEVVTFAGRHTPPPAPTLLPPAIVPPPGTRPPTAAPIITTGPPPTSPEPAPTSGPALESAPGLTPEPTTIDGEAELTVDRSALIQAREAARSQVSTGPSVLAVLCSAGHPTPPHSDHCRVCGSGIPPQEPFSMARPPLGVLRLSTGDVVTLDRSVLLGRAPRLAEGHSAADRPHVVKVPSPERDVSRNHVEVVLEGWHVLIRDLGTTNGTTVVLPGEAPVRLRANDQQVLEAGSLVSMADEVSFVFEAAP